MRVEFKGLATAELVALSAEAWRLLVPGGLNVFTVRTKQDALLIAGHVVGMPHESGGVNLSCVRIDQFSAGLMDGIPVFP